MGFGAVRLEGRKGPHIGEKGEGYKFAGSTVMTVPVSARLAQDGAGAGVDIDKDDPASIEELQPVNL